MNTIEILQMTLAEGVILSINEVGKLRIDGEKQSIEKWLPQIKKDKQAIRALLSSRQTAPTVCSNCKRSETIEIQGKATPGCLYPIEEGEWTEGWRRRPDDLKQCIFY